MELGFHSAFRRPATAEVGRPEEAGGRQVAGGQGTTTWAPVTSPQVEGVSSSLPESLPLRRPTWGPAAWQGLHELCPPCREKRRELSAGTEAGSARTGPGEAPEDALAQLLQVLRDLQEAHRSGSAGPPPSEPRHPGPLQT